MAERPILFSAPMVRAILNGSKTQTRRVVKPVGRDGGFVIVEQESGLWWPYRSDDGESMFVTIRERGKEFQHEIPMSCPYGQLGDKLWVREAWAPWAPHPDNDDTEAVIYRATDSRAPDRWIPSIHMPRWASRITLELTGVRVERLQDISEADAMAEGIQQITGYDDEGPETCYHWDAPSNAAIDLYSSARSAYRALWESINGPGSWDANPWAWVVEFKVETPNG